MFGVLQELECLAPVLPPHCDYAQVRVSAGHLLVLLDDLAEVSFRAREIAGTQGSFPFDKQLLDAGGRSGAGLVLYLVSGRGLRRGRCKAGATCGRY